jgi:uncharacterized protein
VKRITHHVSRITMTQKGPRPKHVPQRSCVVCRQKRDKRQLTRLVRTESDGVVVDPTGKRNGRGTYVCDQPACWDKIIQTALLDRVFSTVVGNAEKAAIAARRPLEAMVVDSGKDANESNENSNRNS